MSTSRIDISKLGEPWPTLFEVAENVDTGAWVLAGGLMASAHAHLAGLPAFAVRPTEDVDILIDVLSTQLAARKVTQGLERIGFALVDPSPWPYAHRFTRGASVIDVLVVDHPPKNTYKHNRAGRWPIMFIDGGQSAVNKKMEVELVCGDRKAVIYMPDQLGALVLKCAAARQDQKGMRHLQDAAMLASLIEDPFAERLRLQGSDCRRLRYAWDALRDPAANIGCWDYLEEAAVEQIEYVFDVLTSEPVPLVDVDLSSPVAEEDALELGDDRIAAARAKAASVNGSRQQVPRSGKSVDPEL